MRLTSLTRADTHRHDSRMVDPNRAHLFVENDRDRRCYRCGDRKNASIHDGPWLRGDPRWA